ncbi:MAG: DNA-3-methyladenine glycosylase 2 family protein, partial [Spirulinaceae cyanobacterium RM2_2_10]|nr:DNA-3-methyladenine glycosylase 2 family protein [Spirulinaceae cyanobacterium RM2_2_10]
MVNPAATADFTAATTALAASDPAIAPIIAQIGPCTLGQQAKNTDLLHELAVAIIHQQISRRSAASTQAKFLALYDGGATLTAPRLLATPDETLRAAGLSRVKIRYLRDLATKIAAGLPSLTELARLEDEEIIKILTAIIGIGRWSVQMLLIFRLYRPDVWPSNDLAIRSAVGRFLTSEELPKPKVV